MPRVKSEPPTYTIDLSLPPNQRYVAIAKVYKAQLQELIPLFNDTLSSLGIPSNFHVYVNRLARLVLRRVHSSVESAELQGIARVTGISMYLLVALNVVLDLLMGCTSGAVQSLEAEEPSNKARMLHFRTLDWGMDALRSIIVQLNFVRTRSKHPGEVIARSITYVGFVGILTGVRKDLSMSLNFRAIHNATTRKMHFKFYLHHLLVLFGVRPSISSILRSYLFSESQINDNTPEKLDAIRGKLAPIHTTAAYLIFSDGKAAITMEKDYDSASTRRSSTFIAITNHDVEENAREPQETNKKVTNDTQLRVTGLEELLEDSRERLDWIGRNWQRKLRKKNAQWVDEQSVTATKAEVIRWLSDWPATNESTHFATVLDPQNGRIVWISVYRTPVESPVCY